MKLALVVVLAALAVPLTGCGGEDNVTALQRIITEQLPAEVEKQGIKDLKVSSVTCTEAEVGKYDCTAKVDGVDAEGKDFKEDVGIEGTCNDDACRWETQ